MRVYEYTIHIANRQVVQLPRGSQILTIQLQRSSGFGGLIDERVQLWALADETHFAIEDRIVRCYGTGHPIEPIDLQYISTIQVNEGALVFHFFEELTQGEDW